MKKLSFLIIGAVLFLSSCGWNKVGPDTTESFSVDSIHSVQIEAAIDANIFYGETQSVVITGTETYMPHVNVSVSNGVLIISMDPGNYPKNNLAADITIPVVDMVNLKGSGDIWIDNFSVNSLDLSIDGSGDISTETITVAEELHMEIDGSGNIDINGSATNIDASIDGSGNISAFDIPCNNATASIDGSGNIEINTSDNLTVDIEGSGNVTYQGNPTVSTNITGSGNVSAD